VPRTRRDVGHDQLVSMLLTDEQVALCVYHKLPVTLVPETSHRVVNICGRHPPALLVVNDEARVIAALE